jgi:hypothetical protein
MISWIMATRDDGYGGECEGVDNFTMRRLSLTVESIRAIRPGDEIVVVDWNPIQGSSVGRLFEYIPHTHAVRVIECESVWRYGFDRLPFYEYAAKTVGASYATGHRFIFCNPDNIFPAHNFNGVMIELGMIVRGTRYDIPRESALLSPQEIVEAPDIQRKYPRAAGDYMGIHSLDFWRLGGFDLRHANWGCDNEFLERCVRSGMKLVRDYDHYHIDHDFAGSEASDRPKDFPDSPSISPGEMMRLIAHSREVK